MGPSWTRTGWASLEVTRVSCQELGKYLLLDIAPLPNGNDFSNGLRNQSHVMLSSCKGRLDLYTERVSKQRSKDFKHVVFDRDTRRPYMHPNTHR